MDEGTGKIKIEASWKQSFELLKAYIEECHHRFNNRHIAGFPNKHTRLLSRVKYTRKKINDGSLEDWMVRQAHQPSFRK